MGGYLWAPTGARESFVSTGEVRGEPQAIAGGRIAERVVWSAALGALIQGDSTFAGVAQGAMFKWGGGAGVLLLENRHLQLGAEISGDVTPRETDKHATNAELLFDARYRVIDDLELALGAGPGLTPGIGTPAFRGVLSIAYTPEQKEDRDKDGIPDAEDACPDVKGIRDPDPKKNGCPPPPPDRDGDGIPDVDDACPDVKGVANPDPKKNGCPSDRDGDGIIDSEDACPDVKGVASTDPKKNGCPPPPPDRDGDGIPDAEDACPDVKGVRTDDPKTNGCPPAPKDRDGDGIVDAEDACPDVKGVRQSRPEEERLPPAGGGDRQGNRHLRRDPVRRRQGHHQEGERPPHRRGARACSRSTREIVRIEVQGHTDNTGSAPHNRILSSARANAVAQALAKRGIVPKRLTSKGYGQEKPIADNGTEEGRHKNRRVQFAILESKPLKPKK